MFKINKEEDKILTFQEKTIVVSQTLSSKDVYDLVMITLQESIEGAVYNPVALNVHFHVNFVKMITDLEFPEDYTDFEIFDNLLESGALTAILESTSEKIYKDALTVLRESIDIYTKNNNSVIGLLQTVLATLPEQIQEVKDMLENMDPEKFKNVINFANAANGNRDFQTNQEL